MFLKRLTFMAIAYATLAVSRPSAASIVYTVISFPGDQEGATLTGTITTDGTIGVITATEIIAWQFSVSKPSQTPYSFASTDSNPLIINPIASADASNFYVTDGGGVGFTSDSGTIICDNDTDQYASAIPGPDFVPGWFDSALTVLPTDGSDWLIASVAAAVPEPSCFTFLLVVCPLMLRRVR